MFNLYKYNKLIENIDFNMLQVITIDKQRPSAGGQTAYGLCICGTLYDKHNCHVISMLIILVIKQMCTCTCIW